MVAALVGMQNIYIAYVMTNVANQQMLQEAS